jgi:hypothetical protein
MEARVAIREAITPVAVAAHRVIAILNRRWAKIDWQPRMDALKIAGEP